MGERYFRFKIVSINFLHDSRFEVGLEWRVDRDSGWLDAWTLWQVSCELDSRSVSFLGFIDYDFDFLIVLFLCFILLTFLI